MFQKQIMGSAMLYKSTYLYAINSPDTPKGMLLQKVKFQISAFAKQGIGLIDIEILGLIKFDYDKAVSDLHCGFTEFIAQDAGKIPCYYGDCSSLEVCYRCSQNPKAKGFGNKDRYKEVKSL
jgi:hypothetical protein